jgi:hypothetical protein
MQRLVGATLVDALLGQHGTFACESALFGFMASHCLERSTNCERG